LESSLARTDRRSAAAACPKAIPGPGVIVLDGAERGHKLGIEIDLLCREQGHQDIVCRLGCGGDRGASGSLAELAYRAYLDSMPLTASCMATETIANVRERRGGEFAPLASWEWTIPVDDDLVADLGSAFLLVELHPLESFLGSSASDSSAPHPASSAPTTSRR